MSQIMTFCSSSILLFLLSISSSLQAQEFGLPKSPIFKGAPEPYLSLDANYSTILNGNVSFTGLGIGVDWPSGVTISVNYYYLSSVVNTMKYTEFMGNWRLFMRYAMLTPSVRFFEWENFSSSIEAGFGKGNILRRDGAFFRGKYRMLLVEPAIRLRYNILPWLNIYGMVGYRFVLPKMPYESSVFSSSKLDVGLSISPFALYQAFVDGELFMEDNGL